MRMRNPKADRNYIPPQEVLSPKVAGISNMEVLYDGGPGDPDNDDYRWSAAIFDWYGKQELGLRWNGHSGGMAGNPQSRGMPTWFIVPDELVEALKIEIAKNRNRWPQKD